MINKIKKWLIIKLAGDTLVVLNATILYNHFPIFADITTNPIIENNEMIKTKEITPFQVYASHIFERVDDTLNLKEKYLESYNNVVNTIIEEGTKESKTT